MEHPMVWTRWAGWFVVAILAGVLGEGLAYAQSPLRCGPFTEAELDPPEPREARWPVQEFEKINAAVKTQPYRVLFFGDSLTERFATDAPELWHRHMEPRGVLNAGVSGDRTEGVRSDLLYLRQRLPAARIGLLGLWPRAMWPDAPLRAAIAAVNRLIKNCGDDRAVFYADIGGVLVDPGGRLTPEVAPDRLHLSPLGYSRLLPALDALIDRLLARH
jgi:hypothetical protein